MTALQSTVPTGTAPSLRRGALALTAAGVLDFILQCLLPVALVRLLAPADFAQYRLAWLAIGSAMALAPLALPRSLYYFLPRLDAAGQARYAWRTLLLLLASGAVAGLVLGPWNGWLPASVQGLSEACPTVAPAGCAAPAPWSVPFLPAFLSLWVAASMIEFLPNARGDAQGQARLLVGLALLRVALVGLAASQGRIGLVFACLLAYAALKLCLVLVHLLAHFPGRAGVDAGGAAGAATGVSLAAQLAFVLPLGLCSALFVLRGQADQWVAATMFAPAAFAAFSIGAVILPVAALVRNSVSHAIAPRLSALQCGDDLAGMLALNQRANLASAFLLLPALALTAVLASHLVVLLYTAAYLDAAGVMRINALALVGVAVEVSTLTVALNQGRFLLAVDAALLLAGLAAAAGGALVFGLPGAALGNALTLAAGNALSFWRVARVTGVPLRRLQRWDVLLRIVLASSGAATVTALLDGADLLLAPLAEALLLAAVFCVVYPVLIAVSGAWPAAQSLFGRARAPATGAVTGVS